MLKLLNFGLFLTFIVSCQSNPISTNRSIANVVKIDSWKDFVKAFSGQAKMSEDKVEEAILSYLKKKPEGATHSNATLAGISDDQIRQISSFSDDLPYIGKIKKWSLENLDQVFPKLKNINYSEIYKTAVIRDRGIYNPYSHTLRSKLINRKERLLVKSNIDQGNLMVVDQIMQVSSKDSKELLLNSLKEYKARGKTEPSIAVNGQEIIKSAILVEQKTGLRGLGKGCEDIIKTASRTAIENKASVDIERALILERMAYEKNQGRQFASISDVPNVKFTQKELDQATELAFRNVMKYGPDQAKKAVRKLKSRPCKVY